jgi:hypothetical protein
VRIPAADAWTFRPYAERALLTGVAVATLVAGLFASLNGLAPLETPKTFALAFFEWSLVFYGVLVSGGLLLSWIIVRIVRRRLPGAPSWLEAVPLVFAALWVLAACLTENRAGVAGLLALDGPPRFRWGTPAACAAAVLTLVLSALPGRAARVLIRTFGVAAPLLALAAFAPEWREPDAIGAPRVAGARDAARRLLVVGIDGADWTLMERLFARGELPHLAALRARGAWGPLDTFVPTRSPAIWNTIATGQPPARHGIEAFSSSRVRGVHATFRRAKKPRGIGFHHLYAVLERTGRVAEGPVTSSARRVPALWNLANRERSPMAVVNWWATWPAEPILGAMVSERVHFWREAARGAPPEDSALTYPESLEREIRSLVLSPDDVTYEQARPFLDVSEPEFAALMARGFQGKTVEGEFKYLFSMFETTRRVALHLAETTRRRYGRPADLMVLFRIVDIASHSALKYSELVDDHLDAPEADVRRFGRTVTEAYRSVDRALGELLRAMGEVNVVVLSDHGFQLEAEGAARTPVYHHMSGPPGVFLAAGPAVRAGRVEGLGVYDALPLLAAVKGFPIADDLPGKTPERVLDAGYRASVPIRRVATYGRRRRGSRPEAGAGTQADQEALERLRALGYIQ